MAVTGKRAFAGPSALGLSSLRQMAATPASQPRGWQAPLRCGLVLPAEPVHHSRVEALVVLQGASIVAEEDARSEAQGKSRSQVVVNRHAGAGVEDCLVGVQTQQGAIEAAKAGAEVAVPAAGQCLGAHGPPRAGKYPVLG